MSIQEDLQAILTEPDGETVSTAISDAFGLLNLYKYSETSIQTEQETITTDPYGKNVKRAIVDALHKMACHGFYDDYIYALSQATYDSLSTRADILYGIQTPATIRLVKLNEDKNATDMMAIVNSLDEASEFFATHTTGMYHLDMDPDAAIDTISPELFYGTSSLHSMTVSPGTSTIGYRAFMNSGLKELWMPNTVTLIGEQAFSGTNLTQIDVPKNVNYIGQNAFQDCASLVTITVHRNEDEIPGAPWGASGSTIIWTGGI